MAVGPSCSRSNGHSRKLLHEAGILVDLGATRHSHNHCVDAGLLGYILDSTGGILGEIATTTNDFHAVDAFAIQNHLFDQFANLIWRATHRFTGIVDSNKIHIGPTRRG